MKHKEYIIPIGEEAKEFDEMFIGVIRKQPELIRCKDCIYYRQEIDMCNEPYSTAHNVVHEDDYCSRAERKEHEIDRR